MLIGMVSVFQSVVKQSRPFFRDTALDAGFRIGVLGGGMLPLGVEELHKRLGFGGRSAHRLQALLDVLVFEGALCRSPGSQLFEKGSAERPKISHGESGWGQCAQIILDGRPQRRSHAERHHAYLFDLGSRDGVAIFGDLFAGQTASQHDARLLVDVGSGSGGYSSAFRELDSAHRTHLLDRAEVLALASERVNPGSSRVGFLPGDFWDTLPEQPANADVVLLANVLHLYGPTDARRLVQLASRCLKPGGQLVARDLWLDSDRRGPVASLYFSLNMALYTESGRVYPTDQVVDWMEDAGLQVQSLSRGWDHPPVIGRLEVVEH